MTAPIAITGQLVDIRNVATHKVARLVVDVPAEQAAGIVSMFGWPTMVNPVPVAIARLNPSSAVSLPDDGKEGEESQSTAATPPPTAKRRFSELPPSQQAAIRCGDETFKTFLEDHYPVLWGLGGAEHVVRYVCDVRSRSDILSGSKAEKVWLHLNNQFESWKLSQQYGENLAR